MLTALVRVGRTLLLIVALAKTKTHIIILIFRVEVCWRRPAPIYQHPWAPSRVRQAVKRGPTHSSGEN